MRALPEFRAEICGLDGPSAARSLPLTYGPPPGRFDAGLTWSDGTSRYVIQHTGAAIMRIRYFAISADHFLWRADRSTDGGKRWLLETWTMEVTRSKR